MHNKILNINFEIKNTEDKNKNHRIQNKDKSTSYQKFWQHKSYSPPHTLADTWSLGHLENICLGGKDQLSNMSNI